MEASIIHTTCSINQTLPPLFVCLGPGTTPSRSLVRTQPSLNNLGRAPYNLAINMCRKDGAECGAGGAHARYQSHLESDISGFYNILELNEIKLVVSSEKGGTYHHPHLVSEMRDTEEEVYTRLNDFASKPESSA